jgi:hypothetical protein
MKPRQRWVSQELDRRRLPYAACAAILSAWAFIPSCLTKEDASTQSGV